MARYDRAVVKAPCRRGIVRARTALPTPTDEANAFDDLGSEGRCAARPKSTAKPKQCRRRKTLGKWVRCTW